MIFRSKTTSAAVPRPIAKARRLTVPPWVSVSQSRHQEVLMAGALLLQPEEICDLGQGDEQTGPGHEPDRHRLGDIARQVAKAEDGYQDLDPTGHHRQKE